MGDRTTGASRWRREAAALGGSDYAMLERIRDANHLMRFDSLSSYEQRTAGVNIRCGYLSLQRGHVGITAVGWRVLEAADELHAARTDPRQGGML